ncbi:hypothetical protein [Haladaptatus sp. DFWS20]|uniref:hypothetical protein n=1 Tax=Haladaptatus sp. DFWS20 TaxID=3403467 RepID=UPI003EBFB5B4
MILPTNQLPTSPITADRLADFTKLPHVREIRVADNCRLDEACRTDDGTFDTFRTFDAFVLITEMGVKAYWYGRWRRSWQRVYPLVSHSDAESTSDAEVVTVAWEAIENHRQSAAAVEEHQLASMCTEKQFDGFRPASDLR